MKKKLKRIAIMAINGILVGIILQTFFLSLAMASDLGAQTIQSVRDVVIQGEYKNASIEECFNAIERKTNYIFNYDEDDLNNTIKINFKSKNKSVCDFLLEISKTGKLKFRQVNNTINVQKLDLSDKNQHSIDIIIQGITITGRVISMEDESGLPGVNVIIKGTAQGTVTDVEGNYSLDVPDEETVLVFSSVGFIKEEITVGNRTVIDIVMSLDITALEEIVVVGYGTKRKADISGAISVVDVDELKTRPSQSAELALQGLASGVNVIPSGVPGQGAKILIRGVTNFGNTDPLVIVDGIQQDLNNISVNDIESIQVLKDAGAATIYGVRGANGVILVTTKKGKIGAPVVSYTGYYGMQYPLPGNPFNVLNSEDYMSLYNVAFGPDNNKFKNGMPDYMYRGPTGSGVAFEGDPNIDPALYNYNSPNRGDNYLIQKVNKVGTDWFHALFKEAPKTEHNISVNGGNDKGKYYFGLGYLNHEGTLVNTSVKRYSARVNTQFNVGKHLRIGENINLIYRDAPGFRENVDFGGIIEVVGQEPIVPLKDIMGNWGGTFGGYSLGSAQNPVAVQYRNNDNDINNQWHLIGNVYAEVDFLKDFTARSSLGWNVVNSYNQNFTESQPENVQGNQSDHSLGVSSGYQSTITFTNTLTYDKSLGKHDFNMLIGSEAISYKGRNVYGYRSSYFLTNFNFLTLNNGTDNIRNSSSIYETSLFSLFSRFNYSYDKKYILTATVRRDGSSRFGPNKRYGIFPSFSLAWRLSKENFMNNLSWLNDLKFRASYGVLGNQANVSGDNSYSLYNQDMNRSYYDITGSSNSIVAGYKKSRIGNENTGWEENVITNIGLDVILFDYHLDISVEYYRKFINGLLFTEPLPAVVIGGASAPSINIGDVSNTGVDVSVTYRNKIGNDINYSVGTNITKYVSNIEDIPDPGYFDAGGNQAVSSTVRNEEGHPISSFFGYQVLGLFNSDEEVTNAPIQNGAEPGRFRFQDTDGDGEITPNDRVFLGNPHPDFTYSLNLGIDYKGFDLSAFFYGSQGNDIYNLTRSYLHFFSFYPYTNKSNELLNAWTPDNMNTTVPKIETTKSFSGHTGSSYYIEDGSFLKLRTLTLGYTLNPAKLQKVGVSNLRLYVQGINLFTITKYTGLDPELIGGSTAVMGVDRATYPNNQRGFIGGISITF